MRKAALLVCLVLSTLILTSSTHGPDLVVKVARDDIRNSQKCHLGIFKFGTDKSMDHKYKIVSYDVFLINYRGEGKWYGTLKTPYIDFNEYEDVEAEPGDVVMIKNVELIHIKSGKPYVISKVNERYLVK